MPRARTAPETPSPEAQALAAKARLGDAGAAYELLITLPRPSLPALLTAVCRPKEPVTVRAFDACADALAVHHSIQQEPS